MKLLNGLLLASTVFSLSACCGGGAKKDDRWDTNNPNKPISATATATPTTAPTTKPTTPTVQPTPTVAPPSGGDKAECKKPGTGALNKAFPADGVDGFKRVYKADKEGYAEAEYTKDKDKLTLTITHSPDKSGEYASVSDKVSGFPYKTFGKNKSNLFVKNCYLVSASSQQVAEPARKTWLGKFSFSSLP